MSTAATTLPTTPPTIAPIGVEDELEDEDGRRQVERPSAEVIDEMALVSPLLSVTKTGGVEKET